MTLEEAKAVLGSYELSHHGDVHFTDLKVMVDTTERTMHQYAEHTDPPGLTADQLEALATFMREWRPS